MVEFLSTICERFCTGGHLIPQFYSWIERQGSQPVLKIAAYDSEIPLLIPHKIKTSCPLKTVFVKLKLFFSSFSTHSVPLIRDHL